MSEFVLTAALTAVGVCVLHGWGRVVRRLADGVDGQAAGNDERSWALTMALGLALLVAFGGVLNLARVAGIWSLSLITAAGLIAFAAPLTRRGARHRIRAAVTSSQWKNPGRPVLLTAALTALAFTVVTQLPPAAYNVHDDLQKYFAHPVRMLQTGTLFGSPLSAIGSEALGGMAFLQAFVVALLPIEYINAVDAVFLRFLCLLLLAGFAWRRPALAPVAVLAMAVLFAINPQYVNVSALYAGSTLILAVVFLTADPVECGDRRPSPLALGMIYAALIALKPTFVLFAGLHALFMTVAAARAGDGVQTGLAWGASVAGWAVLFLSPWIALHGPHYVAGLDDPAPGSAKPSPLIIGLIDLFTTNRLTYGGTLAHYSGSIAVVLICAAAALRHLGRIPAGRDCGAAAALRRSAAATLAAAGAGLTGYLLILLVAGPVLAGYGTALRYFVPVIIALAPAGLCLAALHLTAGGAPRRSPVRIALPIVAAIGIIAAFTPQLVERMNQAVTAGSILAFPRLATAEHYRRYNRFVLGDDLRRHIRLIQQRVPADRPILAWINTPFYLNFRRNPIIDVDIAGLTTAWARVAGPLYVLWQYKGYGVRTSRQLARQARGPGVHERAMARRGLSLAAYLQGQSRRSDILFNDGNMALFRLSAPLRWP